MPVAVQAAEIAAAATRSAAWINAGAVLIAALIGGFVVLALAYWPPTAETRAEGSRATVMFSPRLSVQQRWIYSPAMRLQLREHSYAPYQTFIEERAIELVEASRPWAKLRGRRDILGAVDDAPA